MAFSYTNRRGKAYYLHIGPKRGGGIQHYVSQDATGKLAEAVPEGFEIYETANAQVYLRRKKPSLISEEEVVCVRRALERRGLGWRLKLEVQDKLIIIHESNNGLGRRERARELNPWMTEERFDEIERKLASYMPVMRFVLADRTKRLFEPERYRFTGAGGWISIGDLDTLDKVAGRCIKHLGRESFYELY